MITIHMDFFMFSFLNIIFYFHIFIWNFASAGLIRFNNRENVKLDLLFGFIFLIFQCWDSLLIFTLGGQAWADCLSGKISVSQWQIFDVRYKVVNVFLSQWQSSC